MFRPIYRCSPRLQIAVDVFVCMALMSSISVGMTLFLKWFLSVWCDGGFPFATSVTCTTMALQWILSATINASSKTKTPSLSRSTYWKLAVPIGVCTSLNILCSNLAMLYITITFFTIVKASSHIWTLLFSVWLGHQRSTWPLVIVIVLISSGIALSSYGSTAFDLTGFLLVLAAAVLGTLRWALTQSLLAEIPDSPNQILAVIYYTSPASALSLLPIAIAYDGKDLLQSNFVSDSSLLLQLMGYIVIFSALGFALMTVKILLVKKTSALTLGITGSVSDTTQILFAVMLFGDLLGFVNAIGLAVAMSGMLLYAVLKNRDVNAEDAVQERSDTDGSEEDLEMSCEISSTKSYDATAKHTPTPRNHEIDSLSLPYVQYKAVADL